MDWQVILKAAEIALAGIINTVGVVFTVQFLKWKLPVIKEKLPWFIPIPALASLLIGPAISAVQTYVGQLLGIPIDLSPIIAVFTGGSAVAMYETHDQAKKLRLLKKSYDNAGP